MNRTMAVLTLSAVTMSTAFAFTPTSNGFLVESLIDATKVDGFLVETLIDALKVFKLSDVTVVVGHESLTLLARDLLGGLSQNSDANSQSVIIVDAMNQSSQLFPSGNCQNGHNFETKRPRVVLALMEGQTDAKLILDSLKRTIINCTSRIDPGFYSSENAFLFFANNDEVFETVFNDKEVKRHPQVVGLSPLPNSTAFAARRYNFYEDKVLIWRLKRDELRKGLAELLSIEFPMQGFTFRITAMPYDMYVEGTYLDEFDDPSRGVDFTGGFEIYMIEEICKRLGCSFDVSNPADFSWGHGQTETTNISGFYKDIFEERAHFAMSGVGPDVFRINMARVTNHLDVEPWIYTIVTPRPETKRSITSIVRPFTAKVWAVLLFFLICFPAALCFVAKEEEATIGRKFSRLSSCGYTYWYCVATLAQEHLYNTTKTRYSYATLVACITWLMSMFVITSSYGGSLRAFLITPEMEAAIDTMEDLVNSGLTWNMVLFGESLEKEMATSEDPVMQTVWREKEEAQYEDFPYERMKSVYEGKSSMLEYGATIDTTVETAFTLPNGQRLVHVPKDLNLGMTMYTSWPFHPLNPWFDRINFFVEQILETGIRHRLGKTSRRRLRQKYLKGLLDSGEITPVMQEMSKVDQDTVQGLHFDDIMGVFALTFMFYLLIWIIFVVELISDKFRTPLDTVRAVILSLAEHYC